MAAFTAVLFVLVIVFSIVINSGLFNDFAKSKIEALFNEEYLGRLELKEVHLNFPDRVTLVAPAIFEEKTNTPALSARRIQARFNFLSLLKPQLTTLSFNELNAEKFEGRIIQGSDGKLNIDRIFTKRDPNKPEMMKIENFRCRKVSIRDASLLYAPLRAPAYDVRSLNLEVTKLFIGKTEIIGNVERLDLSMPDRKFRLKKGSGTIALSTKRSELIDLDLETDKSQAQLSLSFDGLNLFSGISLSRVSKSQAFVHIESLRLHSDDLSQFLDLDGLPKGMYVLKGDARGTLGDLHIMPTVLEFGDSHLGLQGQLLNIQDTKDLSFNIEFEKSKLTADLIGQLTDRENLKKLARDADGIGFSGRLQGKLSDWKTDLNIDTRLGTGSVACDVRQLSAGRYQADGNFSLEKVVPHRLLGLEGVNSGFSGSGTFNGAFTTSGKIESGHAEVAVSNTFWQKQQISVGSIVLDYSAGGALKTSLDLQNTDGTALTLTGTADLSSPVPSYQATGTMKRIDLSKVSNSNEFSTNLNGAFEVKGQGFDPASLNIRTAMLFSPSWVNDFQIRDRSTMTASLVQSPSSTAIMLTSDFMDLSIQGNASFSQFLGALKLTSASLSREMGSPSIAVPALQPSPFAFDYRVAIRNIAPLGPLLQARELQLKGTASGRAAWSGAQLAFDTVADIERIQSGKSLSFANIAFKGAMQCSQTGVSSASVTGTATSAVLSDQEIKGISLLATYGNSTLNASMDLSIPVYQEKLSTEILARRNGPVSNVILRKFTLSSPNGIWQAAPDSNFDVASNYIRFNRLTVAKGNQTITFDGLLSSSLPGTFQCNLSNFELGELKYFLLSPSLEQLSGRANARFMVSGRPGAKTSSFEMRGAGVTYDDILLGGVTFTAEHYGDRLRFDLDTRNQQAVAGKPSINTIRGSGSIPLILGYSPFKIQVPEGRPIQASLHSDDLSAKFLVYITDLVDDADGVIPTDIRVSGSLPKPDITLTARLNDTKIRIAPTQVNYYLNGEVNGTPSRIDVGNVRIRDEYNGTGTLSGLLRLSGFAPSSVDISATCRDLLLYNKKDKKDDTSFGTVRGTTRSFRFYGDLSAPTAEGDMNVTYADFSLYRQGSNESAKYIGVEKFIEFVPRYPSAAKAPSENRQAKPETQFKYAFLDILQIRNLRLTCNVPLRYTMIFDRIRGERLEASISNMSLNVSKSGQQFSLFGSVDIVGGKYVFSNTYFDLESNGRIVWNNEEIRDGRLDNVTAVKSLSVSDAQTGERDNAKLLLAISGTINVPNVRMGYYLNDDTQPYASANTIGRLSSHIDPNADLNVISLMLSRQWYLHPERQGRAGSIAVSSVGVSAGTGLISSQLSGLVQGLAGLESFNVNLGTDNNGSLRGLELYFALQVPGTGGKVRFIGTGSAPTGNGSSSNNNYYGSSQKIEYRINPKVYIEAYRSYGQSGTTTTISNLQKPTENWGASISYREKFHTWSQFWNRLTGRRRKGERDAAPSAPSALLKSAAPVKPTAPTAPVAPQPVKPQTVNPQTPAPQSVTQDASSFIQFERREK